MALQLSQSDSNEQSQITCASHSGHCLSADLDELDEPHRLGPSGDKQTMVDFARLYDTCSMQPRVIVCSTCVESPNIDIWEQLVECNL